MDFCKNDQWIFFLEERNCSSSTKLFHFLHRVGVKFGRKIPELRIVKNVIGGKNFLDEKILTRSSLRETRDEFTRFAKFEGNKFIYFWIASKKEEGYEKGTNNFSSFACFHTFLYSQSLRSLYVYSILLLFFTPFIRQSIVDDDGNDDVATLPSLFRNSWTSTFIRWSKFPACILLWLKFADFYAVLKCILMLHVGRMARSTKTSSRKTSKKVSLPLSLRNNIF